MPPLSNREREREREREMRAIIHHRRRSSVLPEAIFGGSRSQSVATVAVWLLGVPPR